MPQKWALLCGGDYYARGAARQSSGLPPSGPKSLKGCVKDVELMACFLAQFDVPKKNIRTLTATVGPDGDPVETSDRWPTRTNIRREMQSIKNEAKSITNDTDRLLYFHYSGHGTLRSRIPIFEDNDSNDDFRGTALVMTDIASGGAYLTGRELGLLIKNMVENSGFRATVVLDSCFSGDGFRYADDDIHFTARCLDEIDSSILDADKKAEADFIVEETDDEELRDALGIRTCWLSDPEGCAVITACSRSQTAGETMFDETKQGILTYWLVQTLLRLRSEESQSPWPSHARTVDHVGRRIIRNQRPMLYGEGLFEFFGFDFYAKGEAINATRVGQGVTIDIGSAQGVAVGSIYTVITNGDASEDEHSTRFRVTSPPDRFRSQAEILNLNPVDTWPPREVRRATLHQWALPWAVCVRCPGIASDWDLLAAELSEKPGLLLRDGEPSATDLVIKLDCDDTFRILQDGNLLKRLPIISINQSTWPKKLAQVLSHVARFQTLKELYSSFDNDKLPRGDFELMADDKVEEGDIIRLTLRYSGDLPSIWVSFYCFSASWGISRFFPLSGAAAKHMDVQSGETEEFVDMATSVPPKCRQDDPDQIEDYLFFFISTSDDRQVPSWGDICLPSIRPTGDVEPMEWAQSSQQPPESGVRDDNRDVKAVKKKRTNAKQKSGPRTEWTVIPHMIRINSR